MPPGVTETRHRPSVGLAAWAAAGPMITTYREAVLDGYPRSGQDTNGAVMFSD